jgi:predicted benzoate:H+ symporter BenE
MAGIAVVFLGLAALLIGCALLWFYRLPILAHLGKPGMTLLVVGLAGFFLFFVINIALTVTRLLLF